MNGIRFLLACVLSLLLISAPTYAADTNEADNPAVSMMAPINLNTASKEELTTLTGVGPKRAEAIIAYREANGSFQSVEQITAIRGLGSAFLSKNRDRMTVE